MLYIIRSMLFKVDIGGCPKILILLQKRGKRPQFSDSLLAIVGENN